MAMDESAVSFHTPETNQQAMQWVKKVLLGPEKEKVLASWEKK
jgi:hypothetical protein